MPVKIRLQRRGRKFSKIYSIVVADSRAPRDGKYIETLGQYNPNTNPATITLDFDSALNWLQNGAQPTDTCRAILSYKGVMYKKHLMEGVKKGAFDEAEAEKRFQTWLKDKDAKIQAKVDKLSSDQALSKQERLEAESKVKEARAAEIAKQRSELLEAAAAKDAPVAEAEEVEEAVAEEAKAEETPAEEVKAEETPAEEVKAEEAPAVEAPKAEETPAEAPKAEESPAEAPKAEETPAEAPKAEEAPAEAPKAEEAPAEDKKEKE